MAANTLYLGIDVGTSGCRAVVLDDARRIQARSEAAMALPENIGGAVSQDPRQWWDALVDCLRGLTGQCDTGNIRRLAIDGTSGSVLLCDVTGAPLTPALMYDDRRARRQATEIDALAPADSAARGTSSSLAKVLWLARHYTLPANVRIQHQADWLSGRLTGDFDRSDYHNALKLGFDTRTLCWPQWITEAGLDRAWLPRVVAPGTPLGGIRAETAAALGLASHTVVCAGTTDSTASFLASGASETGDGVTSLGTTLVVKVLSESAVFSAEHGVYSHRLGNRWLIGGASNSGGAVLKQFFTEADMRAMMPRLRPEQATGLDYYPLVGRGERFPVNNPQMAPRLEPVPDDPVILFQALLEGIAAIEQRGYALLARLGAPAVTRVFTTGSGSQNPAWTRIRSARLGVPVVAADSIDAAFGTALLAVDAVSHQTSKIPAK